MGFLVAADAGPAERATTAHVSSARGRRIRIGPLNAFDHAFRSVRPSACSQPNLRRVRARLPGIVVAALFALPVALLAIGSLRPPGLATSVGTGLLPAGPSLDAFPRAFELQPLARQALNSLFVAGLA